MDSSRILFYIFRLFVILIAFVGIFVSIVGTLHGAWWNAICGIGLALCLYCLYKTEL